MAVNPFVDVAHVYENYNYVWDDDTLGWVKQTAAAAAAGSDVNVTNTSIAVTGPLTDTQLRASDVKITLDGEAVTVSGSVSVSNFPAVETGLATTAKQDTGNTSLASIDGKLTSPLAVSGTFYPVTQPVSVDSLPLPPGAATEGGNLALLAAIDFATQTTLALLTLAQGTTSTDAVGPMVQGVVNDSPQSYLDGIVRPLSLTSQGRVRVSTVQADVGQVWESIQDSPWSFTESPWVRESVYV